MLYVNENDGSIKLTRGDTAKFSVSITYKNNQGQDTAYTIAANDTIRMTVKKSTKDTSHLIQKVVTGTGDIIFNPSDTDSLAFGKYKYDVELTKANNEVYTVIGPNIFEITEEVT